MSGSDLSLSSQQANILYSIDRLLDPYLPSHVFKHELRAFLGSSAYGLALQAANPGLHEPFTTMACRFIYRRIEATGPRLAQTSCELAAAEAMNHRLVLFKSRFPDITRESVIKVLGSPELFDSFMNPRVFTEIKELKNRARRVKATLQRRIWTVNAEVEQKHMELPEVGDLLLRLLTEEGKWHCECGNLFDVEQENRDIVRKWFEV